MQFSRIQNAVYDFQLECENAEAILEPLFYLYRYMMNGGQAFTMLGSPCIEFWEMIANA
jgi:hypothetical protein